MFASKSIFALALVSLSALFLGGCLAEANEPEQLIWYDDEFGACFTEGKDGKSVEVPCDDLLGRDLGGEEGTLDTGAK